MVFVNFCFLLNKPLGFDKMFFIENSFGSFEYVETNYILFELNIYFLSANFLL